MTQDEILDLFLDQEPHYEIYCDRFVGAFSTLKQVIDYYPDWWEDRYVTMSNDEIVHEWRERNNIRCVEFNGTWLLFSGCDG